MRILFITWDGPQVPYLETLFLPIFTRLAAAGFHFHILQFTWGDPTRLERTRRACEEAGFSYRPVIVARRPKALGALLTAIFGAWHVRRQIREHAIDVLMPRSTLPALAVLLTPKRIGRRVIFDADGLPLDERVEFAGDRANSASYRLLRDVEAQAVRRADRVLVRSSQAVQILAARAGAGTDASRFHVVANGRDSGAFATGSPALRDLMRASLGVRPDEPLIVYAGSMGPKYRLQEMLHLFKAVRKRREDARFLILTNDPGEVELGLGEQPALRDVVLIKQVLPETVPAHLACADLGVALIQQTLSMRAAAPIKLGEYLLCGVPTVITGGIGDSSSMPVDCGFVVATLETPQLAAAADWFVDTVLPDREGFRRRCRALGEERYSLDACAESYLRALLGMGEDA
ncbi:glycosyltransferase [Luteimonas sp. MHLX1A]|uniref:glycosyltransferase n=1 Tax=Alterluteimonas muca TaxID=2878684 RepID=UPI001E5F87D5|nr:glycosyltransferase [Luteimonas sp. MHLX1A]MCD9047150.1 glycosyltransferase [Luteimonas sp. MHLX1A]